MSSSRRVAASLLAGCAALVLAGCTAMGGVDDQARAGESKDYIAGDGSVAELAPSSRTEPVEVSGTTAEGEELALADLRGEVVVLNLWYAACGPCRAEAADLAEIARESEADGVRFVGINTRDDAGTAVAFQETFDVPYPTIVDRQGSAVLALRGQLVPNAVPTTLVVDREGRVAARISGEADPSVLRTLIEDVVEEQS
jgi:peroxiredoxin